MFSRHCLRKCIGTFVSLLSRPSWLTVIVMCGRLLSRSTTQTRAWRWSRASTRNISLSCVQTITKGTALLSIVYPTFKVVRDVIGLERYIRRDTILLPSIGGFSLKSLLFRLFIPKWHVVAKGNVKDREVRALATRNLFIEEINWSNLEQFGCCTITWEWSPSLFVLRETQWYFHVAAL